MEGRGLGAADETAYDLGRGRRALLVVAPEDDAAEGPRGQRVGEPGVEGVGVVDGEQEGRDAPEGGDVLGADEGYRGLRM